MCDWMHTEAFLRIEVSKKIMWRVPRRSTHLDHSCEERKAVIILCFERRARLLAIQLLHLRARTILVCRMARKVIQNERKCTGDSLLPCEDECAKPK